MSDELITNHEFGTGGWSACNDGWSMGNFANDMIEVPGSVIQLKDTEFGGEAVKLGIEMGPNTSATIEGISIKRIYRFLGRTWMVPVWGNIIRRLFKRTDIKVKVGRQYSITYRCLTIHNTEKDGRKDNKGDS